MAKSNKKIIVKPADWNRITKTLIGVGSTSRRLLAPKPNTNQTNPSPAPRETQTK